MRYLCLAFPMLFLMHVLSGYRAAPQQAPSGPVTLETVYKSLDAAAAKFTTTQANFEWDRYEKVIDEVDDVETGVIYYRRVGKDVEMKADIKMDGPSRDTLKPEAKFVLFSQGKVQMYLPKPDQVTVYDSGKNRSELEAYLVVLGFGGSGQDLAKSFDVIYQGQETVEGISAAKLQLIPKSERVRNTFARILLWIDLDRGISVQQQFFEPDGNYKLTKYSSIREHEKIPDEVFHLKTTAKTQIISPRG
ncbi:MAG: outer membrane lipoprotein carrier protein LolA [Candidatus Sulfotelmatobacter sp.]